MRARRSAFIAALIIASLPLFATSAQAALSQGVGISTNGLVMYWDAANPNSYSGSGTSWNDISVNNYNSTVYNSPAYTHGSGGSFFTFNPASSQYAAAASNNISFTGGFSISFYANFGSTANNWERIIDFGNGELANNILIGREGATSNLWFEVHNAGSSKGVCRATSAIGVNTLDQYTFIVASDGLSCGFYKNGSYVATTVVSGTDFRPNSSITRANNYIGRSNWAADSYFEGTIHDVAIYNRPLGGAEITQNYNAMVDVTWPTLSGGNNSVNENQVSATTVGSNQSSTFSISGGADLGKFNIDASTGVLTFKSAPNYEAPDDFGTNRIYDVIVRALDANGNYNDYTFTIALLDLAEYASLSTPTLSAIPYKGVNVTITVTPIAGSTAGKMTYLIAGKRIVGCYQKSYSGTGNSTCTWKPSTMGNREIAVTFTPNGSEYAPATVKKTFTIFKRTTTR